jgi:hypothetical protein
MVSTLDRTTGYRVYARSLVEARGSTYALARGPEGKVLAVEGDAAGFQGRSLGEVVACSLTAANAEALRNRLPWLRPQRLGLQISAGCGDRLGLATPGHIRAIRGTGIAPIFAQQSMRENARTGRSPQQVMDEAMWGVFEEGWRAPWGADADHLMTTDDIDLCVAAGYTFFTIDPGAHVDNEAHTAAEDLLRDKVEALPWDQLDDSPEALHQRYLDQRFEAGTLVLAFDQVSLLRAAAKYGRAIAHTARMYCHLARQATAFELEVSVDETETPTSPLEHYFVASELKRLGVEWVSLAPRYIGRFEKGTDYIGDLDAFDLAMAKHAAIARALGPYKLSIHSGSDKFSVYPIFARHAGPLVHLKTAGTSYLEALRAIARVDPGLFREILDLAMERYSTDRLTYHVSAEISKIPEPSGLVDSELAVILDLFDGREVLHVTFGSVLDHYGQKLLTVLDTHEEPHYDALHAHFDKHLAPFLF